MSEPDNPPNQQLATDQAQHVPWRSRFRGSSKGDDPRLAGFMELLSSNKNNPVKARIPNVFGMCTVRLLGAVSSPKKTIEYMAEGTKKTVPKTVAGLEQFFYDNWNTISQGYQGLARDEAVRMGLLGLSQEEDIEKGKRITDEGSRKK